MSRDTRREFDRFLRRQRIMGTLKIALPVAIGAGLLAGLMWLRSHGGPPWIGLALAGAAALAKPALLAIRVFEKRRRRNLLD